MKLAAFNKLKKIMDRTLSENDHEALASLRAANKIIADAGVSWERFFDRSVRIDVEQDPERPADESFDPAASPPPKRVDAPDEDTRRIETAFTTIEEHDARRYEGEFIQSLLRQWGQRAWLSDKQKESLFDNERRATERR